MANNGWTTVLDVNGLNGFYQRTARLDPSFSAAQRGFYESRTPAQLATLAYQAWMCNEAEAYMLARSHAAALAAR